ncbi:MAG: sulfatase-like hydrolase/transferase [Oscillospiraceae bacterium]|nr:sulfatase-like hydrolase/transferase [Oscillospiraceae bacterium]
MFLKNFALKVWRIKKDNMYRHKKLKAALIIFFPILLVFTTELNHMQSFTALCGQIIHNFTAFAFELIVIYVIFFGILFLTRSATFTVFITWVTLFTFSWVEYYKFVASGTHFVVTDMAMIGNASDMTKFTTVSILTILNLNFFIMLAYVISMFFLNIKIKFKFVKSFIVGFICLGVFTCFIVFPALSARVYSVFGITPSESVDSFVDNEKFDRLNFIPYFVESATNLFTYALKPPDNFTENKLKEIIKPADAVSNKTNELEKVNVIYILSESFADFRVFTPDDPDLNSVYTNFDIMRKEGFAGTCVVPTFGGYTTRSEFELLFGLPLQSIGTPVMPNNKLKRVEADDIIAIPDFYRQNGYTTTYIHPFSRTFYNRGEIYSKYGFDNMIFDDNLKDNLDGGPIKDFKKYISDETVFDCIVDKIKNTDGPNYIMATTMQNHVPYSSDDEPDVDEYHYYLEGIKETDRALGELRNKLKTLDEKCIVVFCGDHFPFFVSDNNKYEQLNITSDNCAALYEQHYLVWANFDLGETAINTLNLHNKISMFYIPNLIAEIQGLPKSSVINTVLGEIDNEPIYSQFYDRDNGQNYTLDMLTYDLIIDRILKLTDFK